MSAFLVSDLHINIVHHYFITCELSAIYSPEHGSCLGEIAESCGFPYMSAKEAFKLANILAVNKLYAHECQDDFNKFENKLEKVEPLQLIKLIDCLMYQCAEFSKEDTSKNALFVNRVIDVLQTFKLNVISKLTSPYKWTV